MPAYTETPIDILLAVSSADVREVMRERFEASRLGGVLRFASDRAELEEAIGPRGADADACLRTLPDLIIAGSCLIHHMHECLTIQSRHDERLVRIPILRLVTSDETVPVIPASPARLLGSIRLPLDTDDMAHIGRILVQYWLELVLGDSGRAAPPISARAA